MGRRDAGFLKEERGTESKLDSLTQVTRAEKATMGFPENRYSALHRCHFRVQRHGKQSYQLFLGIKVGGCELR